MKTKLFYHFILVIYVSLWICQLIACHLTHSLIILTDSYINLYRIFDISLGIIHLSTQQQLAKSRSANQSMLADGRAGETRSTADKGQRTMAERFFEVACTYQFKRLPLLGSFVNGIFLAALLMLAGFEGVQTCFHVKHSENHNKKTILTENVITYPIILVGFAVVGLVMQYCTLKAHEMREEELCSESYLNLTPQKDGKSRNRSKERVALKELNVNELAEHHLQKTSNKRRSYDLNLKISSKTSSAHSVQDLPLAFRANSEIPTDEENRISLRSLKFPTDSDFCGPLSLMQCRDVEASNQDVNKDGQSLSERNNSDKWFLVRCLASPGAMTVCAMIFYFIDIELMTEISDAALAISVVGLLFAASYPPMKKAGRILLQTIPDGVDLDRLEQDLLHCGSGGAVMKVKELHVWSLTPRSNRVATCQLILNLDKVSTKCQVEHILNEAKFRFLDQHIRCLTIEPVLILEENLKESTSAVKS